MHAFVDVGDGVARGGDQRIAAAFGFAQRRFQPAHRAAVFQDAELAPHRELYGLRLAAQRIGPHVVGDQHQFGLVVDVLEQRDDGDVLRARGQCGKHFLERNGLGGDRGQNEIAAPVGEHGLQILARFRAARADGDASVAKQADALFGVFQLVVDEDDADDGILIGHGGWGVWFVGLFYTLIRSCPASKVIKCRK
jgi:hypothetical protein